MYALHYIDGVYEIIDAQTGSIVNEFMDYANAHDYLEQLNGVENSVPTEWKMSWLDSLIH